MVCVVCSVVKEQLERECLCWVLFSMSFVCYVNATIAISDLCCVSEYVPHCLYKAL